MTTTQINPHLHLIDDLEYYGEHVERDPFHMVDLPSVIPGVSSIRVSVSTEAGEDTFVYAFANPHGLIAWDARFSASVPVETVMAFVGSAIGLDR